LVAKEKKRKEREHVVQVKHPPLLMVMVMVRAQKGARISEFSAAFRTTFTPAAPAVSCALPIP
jgi:hypothetical protein